MPSRRLANFFDEIDMNNDGFISFDEWRYVIFYCYLLGLVAVGPFFLPISCATLGQDWGDPPTVDFAFSLRFFTSIPDCLFGFFFFPWAASLKSSNSVSCYFLRGGTLLKILWLELELVTFI